MPPVYLPRPLLSGSAYRLTAGGVDGNESTPPVVLSDAQRSIPIQSEDVRLWLTDELLFNFQRCSRRAFLDLYGDSSRRDPPSDYLRKLRQDSISHQLTVLQNQPIHQPTYARQNWQEGAASTLELMRQGVERIKGGVLLAEYGERTILVSCPDVLVRQPGHSYFGDWIYVPTEIRLGKRPKLDYQVTATFHAFVLAAVQGAWSETSWLVLRQRGAYAVDLVELLPRMQELLDNCANLLCPPLQVTAERSPQEPEVFISHSRCDLCHWYSHCYGIAQEERHLSLLPGVTPSRYAMLKTLQIQTLDELASLSPDRLSDLPGFGPHVAQQVVQQAQATLQNRAMPRFLSHGPAEGGLLSEAELPTAEVELYFDIEAAPEQNLVYLHGVLVVDRVANTREFYPLLAEAPHEEEAIWEEFLDLVWRYPTAPIYHFCPYEVQTVRRLGELYGTDINFIEPLVGRFVDLHERVTRVATLPVESYALKAIARWLGFDWRNPEANGAQSIFWYAQWLEQGDRTYLDAIVQYNEDDCCATHHVKDWLVEFVQLHR